MTQNEHYRHIRSLMVLNGVTNAAVAKKEQVSREYVYYVMTGQRVGRRIRRAIAEAVGVKVQELWADDDEKLPKAA